MNELEHDSKMAHKINAYHEVQNELKKQILRIKQQIDIKKGVALGFKAATENIISQLKNFQIFINNEENEIDLATARIAVDQLTACINILTKNGHQQELEVAGMHGQLQSLENQIKSTELLIAKQQAKPKRGEQLQTKRDSKQDMINKMRERRAQKAQQKEEAPREEQAVPEPTEEPKATKPKKTRKSKKKQIKKSS